MSAEQLEREHSRRPLTARIVELPAASRATSRVRGAAQELVLGT